MKIRITILKLESDGGAQYNRHSSTMLGLIRNVKECCRLAVNFSLHKKFFCQFRRQAAEIKKIGRIGGPFMRGWFTCCFEDSFQENIRNPFSNIRNNQVCCTIKLQVYILQFAEEAQISSRGVLAAATFNEINLSLITFCCFISYNNYVTKVYLT